MFFMGNPGDYAWGREGLDSVITQMLNQMENSGPPPLAKEKIQDIPRIEITDEQVSQKLQCSVCWDDFEKMETVRKLPCTVSNEQSKQQQLMMMSIQNEMCLTVIWFFSMYL